MQTLYFMLVLFLLLNLIAGMWCMLRGTAVTERTGAAA